MIETDSRQLGNYRSVHAGLKVLKKLKVLKVLLELYSTPCRPQFVSAPPGPVSALHAQRTATLNRGATWGPAVMRSPRWQAKAAERKLGGRVPRPPDAPIAIPLDVTN